MDKIKSSAVCFVYLSKCSFVLLLLIIFRNMDSPSPSRYSGFSARNSFVDVSQLDKVNAIPNKTADNVLLSNLCPEDQHYLKFLMENDSSNSEDELEQARHSSSGAWSPMVQSPMVKQNKRKLRPSSAITLSLEDISYIRPSWGISKGIRTIEVDGKKNRKKLEKSDSSKDVSDTKSAEANKNETVIYRYFLILLTIVVVSLTLPPYLAEQRRFNNQTSWNKLKVNKKLRLMEIYRPDLSNNNQHPLSEPILRVNFGLGVPANLKPEECTCLIYETELLKHFKGLSNENGAQDSGADCFSCLDWAVRANLRVLVEHRADASICYDVKWQSYDNLATPLIDCFFVEKNSQWFGLGDIRSADWALNDFDSDWIPLVSNLTAELTTASSSLEPRSVFSDGSATPSLGSHANFTLFSTSGIFIGDLKSDFKLSVKVDRVTEGKRICFKASCNDKCSRFWWRTDDLRRFKYVNNILEYRICSSADAKSLISSQISRRVQSLDALVKARIRDQEVELLATAAIDRVNGSMSPMESRAHYERLTEKESNQPANLTQTASHSEMTSTKLSHSIANSTSSVLSSNRVLPEAIGLIERTIFATSPEFMSDLDGKSLRQYVDGVVKLSLKTSVILSIDSRWETYVGSLQLNTALFPKWRLLFEIIHNKGFKVLLTVKPFVDTAIGAGALNQLFEAGRLLGISQSLTMNLQRPKNDYNDDDKGIDHEQNAADRKTARETILRRKGLFSFKNETIEIIGQQTGTDNSEVAVSRPFVFKCKESRLGYCALLDLTRAPTRGWLINQIGRSELLTSSAIDGIRLAGGHPAAGSDHYREGLAELTRSLFFRERIFTLPQWAGELGFIQLGARPFTWLGLRSVVNSALNLGLEGFSLIHPGSVWGDLKSAADLTTTSSSSSGQGGAAQPGKTGPFVSPRKEIIGDEQLDQASERASAEELCIRWLQVSVFLPILQFNNLAPIERFGLQGMLQSLVRMRKLHIIAELKKNLPFTPLISQSTATTTPTMAAATTRIGANNSNSTGGAPLMPLIRPVWFSQTQHSASEPAEWVVADQFSVGPDILVAPILDAGKRQRDIYLPSGFWHDELRQMNIRGGKWLRNYPVELSEIAWFARAKR